MNIQSPDGKGFIIKVWEDQYVGGRWKYINVDSVAPGTTVYHGQFKKKVDNVSQQSGYQVEYEPVGELTAEVVGGPGGVEAGATDTF